MKELYIGMATIIAGIITAIVHIFITLKAKQSAEKISKENLLQQEGIFKRSKHYEYLNEKRLFLEMKVNEIYNIKDSIELEKGEDPIVDRISFDILKFQGIAKAIAKTRHYLNESEIKVIAEFEATLVHYWQERGELIETGQSNDSDNLKNMDNLKMFNETLKKMPEMIETSIQILTNSLKETIIQIERTINAT
jgi:hypothetical protein